MAARGQKKVKPAAAGRTVAGQELQEEVRPESASLSEPYPNPFNPRTTVPFAVPQRSHVTVEVYNMLGRRVALLADRTFRAGRHQLPLNGQGLSSGIYFVRLQVGEQLFSQKVTLIK